MQHTQRTFEILDEARAKLRRGEARGALELLRSAELQNYASTHLIRATCLYQLGSLIEAKEQTELVLRAAPNSPMALLLDDLCDARMRSMGSETDLRFGLLLQETLLDSLTSDNLPPAPMGKRVEQDSQSAEAESGLVSETLARIMVEQQKYSEARKVYIHLARENPDRYEYFRERIAEMDSALEYEGKAQPR